MRWIWIALLLCCVDPSSQQVGGDSHSVAGDSHIEMGDSRLGGDAVVGGDFDMAGCELPAGTESGYAIYENYVWVASAEGLQLGFTRGAVLDMCTGGCGFEALRFHLQEPGNEVCVMETTSLDYTTSQHNWADSATAHTTDTSYTLEMTVDLGTWLWTDTLTARDRSSGDVLWGPIVLELVSFDGDWR